jgi:hypothetical protein
VSPKPSASRAIAKQINLLGFLLHCTKIELAAQHEEAHIPGVDEMGCHSGAPHKA